LRSSTEVGASASDLVVAGALLGAVRLRDGVGAVQRVVQRAPACVGGVEREAGVEHRHDQLRACGGRDLGVDASGGDLERLRRRQQVADLLQERLVRDGVVGLAGAVAVPGVDLCLQVVALGEQRLVLGGEVLDHLDGAGPERVDIDAGAGERLGVHEVVENLGDLKATDLHAFSH
jgi:hypothetical protein